MMHYHVLALAFTGWACALPQQVISPITSPLAPTSFTTGSVRQVDATEPSDPTGSWERSGTTTAATVVDSAYVNTVIRHHNAHRSNHSVTAIKWSPVLADIAKSTAEVCYWAHNTTAAGGGYGQNIGAGYSSKNMGAFITGMYNSEVAMYRSYGAEPSFAAGIPWGHFTQIVWAGTTTVGCYTADCSTAPGGLRNTGGNVPPYFTVCNYGPAGNMVGSFAANVRPAKNQATIGQSYGCTGQANPNINCV